MSDERLKFKDLAFKAGEVVNLSEFLFRIEAIEKIHPYSQWLTLASQFTMAWAMHYEQDIKFRIDVDKTGKMYPVALTSGQHIEVFIDANRKPLEV